MCNYRYSRAYLASWVLLVFIEPLCKLNLALCRMGSLVMYLRGSSREIVFVTGWIVDCVPHNLLLTKCFKHSLSVIQLC